jgi:cyclophilin family peptidyl-prolyl cis-trans isomerase
MKNLILALALIYSTFCYSQTEVTFYTSNGDFTVTLSDSLMPITTGNFINLVNSNTYDGKRFYRVVANFVIQGGVWPSATPPAIPDEFDSTGALSNVQGTISMANAGPNTGSSEIFINLKDNTFLDYDKAPTSSAHPVFGSVTANWSVVSNIGMVPVNSNDQPITPVVMDSVRVTTSGLSNSQIKLNSDKSAVYPNPINSESVLDLFSSSGGVAQIMVLDLYGKLLLDSRQDIKSGKNLIPLSDLGLGELKGGQYVLQVSLEDGDQVFRIQKN